MEDKMSRARKVLFYVLVVACVFAILRTLYNSSYYPYKISEAFRLKDFVKLTLGYRIYDSEVLSHITNVCFYAGLISVYVFWKKPRPTWLFVLIIAAGIIPGLVNKTIIGVFNASIYIEDYYFNYYNIVPITFFIIWEIGLLITIARLYKYAEKQAKTVLLGYLIIFYFSTAITITTFFINIGAVLVNMSFYIGKAANIYLYVMTIVYLKKKLGEQMPFINMMRFLKKECTNRAPED